MSIASFSSTLRERAAELIYREAMLLDERKWHDWLALYTDDAVLWMPSWANESETTTDPELELNLIYLKGHAHLEDRVFRLETNDSFASVPMARTVHVVGNVLVTGNEAGTVTTRASWLVHTYDASGGLTRGGSYEHRLREEGGALKIAAKKIVMIDDKLVGPVDFYHV